MIEKTIKPIRIVLTGGPGVGKSTVLELLAHQGYSIVPEAARLVIERELQKDSDCLPWRNLQKFQDSVSSLQFELENSAEGPIIFSDRGIVDGFAYSKLDRIIVPEIIINQGKRRYQHVFLLSPLPNYEQDSIRREDQEKTNQIQEALRLAYLEFGYIPVEVPFLAPVERVDFILNKLRELKLRFNDRKI